MVLVFTLFLRDDVNEDGTLKEGAESRVAESAHATEADHEHEHDEEETLKKAREAMGTPPIETHESDVD